MKNEFVQFVLALIILVVGSAVEELLPKVAGVGFPVLMAAAVFVADRRRVLVAVLFSIAAGAAEDSISGLPAGASASFFLAVAALARWSEFPHGALVMTYPVYQLWLRLWTGSALGGVFGRVLIAVPFGFVTAVAVWLILAWAERKAAVDES